MFYLFCATVLKEKLTAFSYTLINANNHKVIVDYKLNFYLNETVQLIVLSVYHMEYKIARTITNIDIHYIVMD